MFQNTKKLKKLTGFNYPITFKTIRTLSFTKPCVFTPFFVWGVVLDLFDPGDFSPNPTNHMAPVCAKACTALVTSIRSPLISLEVVALKAWSQPTNQPTPGGIYTFKDMPEVY